MITTDFLHICTFFWAFFVFANGGLPLVVLAFLLSGFDSATAAALLFNEWSPLAIVIQCKIPNSTIDLDTLLGTSSDHF